MSLDCHGGIDLISAMNRCAELGDQLDGQENGNMSLDQWCIFMRPLKKDFMWIETVQYCLESEGQWKFGTERGKLLRS